MNQAKAYFYILLTVGTVLFAIGYEWSFGLVRPGPKTLHNAYEVFSRKYEHGENYDKLYEEAKALLLREGFLASEINRQVTIGRCFFLASMLAVLWAFDRRRLSMKLEEVQKQNEGH